MPLRVAVQMDPIERIAYDFDSTFALMVEACQRGHEVYIYRPCDLSYLDGRILARARPIAARAKPGDYYTLGEEIVLDLRTDADLVLMRQDPPFNMEYITATHILEHLEGDTLVLNDPAAVRNAPEKLLVTRFREFAPPTLISADPKAIRAFYEAHGDIILKPLYDYGGSLVFHVDRASDNIGSLISMFGRFYKEPIIAQKYIPEIKITGDRRILFIEGVAAGGFARVPQGQEVRAGLYLGGKAVASEMSAREQEICDALGPELRKRGLVFVGIDVIGGYLTEINVTCPSGVRDYNDLYKTRLEVKVWDAFEQRVKEFKGR